MKNIIAVFCLLFAGIGDLSGAFVTVKTGTYNTVKYGVDVRVDYEIQCDEGSYIITGETVPTTSFRVLVKNTHDAFAADSRYSFRGGGFSFALDKLSATPTTTVYGGGYSEPNYFNLFASTATQTYSGSCHFGDLLHLRYFSLSTDAVTGSTSYLPSEMASFTIPSSTNVYYVTFTLPENVTAARRDYFATQSGKTVGSTFQLSGSSTREWRVGPLNTNVSVSLSLITGGRIGWDQVNWLAIPTDETLSVIVNPGVVPLAGTLTTGGGTGPVDNPNTTLPGVTTDPAPTLPTPTGGGGGLVLVPGTSGSTATATTGDISQVAAAVATGANGVITNATSNANGIIGAVNRSITALDKINATLEASKGGSFDDGNIVAGLSSVKSSVDDFKTVTQAHWTTETTTLATAKTAAQSDADSRANSISGNMAAAKDAAASSASTFAAVPGVASSLQLATVNPTPSDNGWALQPYLLAVSDSVVMSGIAGGGGLDLNPFTSPQLANLIGTGTALTICIWIKSFITWAVVIAFLTWTFGQVKENVIAMMTVPQMALPGSTQLVSRTAVLGNSVGVIPAAGLYVFQQLALATFLLASPAITVAILMDTGSAGTLATAASTAAAHTSGTATGFCANALSCMFVVCPVATIITVFLNGLLVRIGSITQFIVTGVVTRTIGV